MGEPLLNLDAVIDAALVLTDGDRFGLGSRHITISTSGVVPGIERLTALGPQWTLAVSLHAARDPLRDLLVPLNRAGRPRGRCRGRGLRVGDRPAGELRVRDDRRPQRHGRGRGRAGAAARRQRQAT